LKSGFNIVGLIKMNIIEVKNFRKSFGPRVIHSDVSFVVKKGECLGLIGGSGTGKSVLLRSLIGLEKPDSGSIIIQGNEISSLPERELVNVRRRVAYAFQDGALFDSMTVYENLAYPLRAHFNMKESEIAERIQSQLNEFGLPEAGQLYPANLSGGMQKRIGLARAMIMNPEVVLYDEPTAGLDPFNTKRIQELILKLKAKGVSSILVTHDMPTAFAVCDDMVFLGGGKVIASGSINDLKNQADGPIQRFINGEL